MKITVLDVSLGLPLILLLVILFFTLFLTIILITKNRNMDNKVDTNNLFSWIEKKDLLYWLIILCLGAISCLTFQYSGNKNAVSHWGFAGTIVSIILAVVAIGFTLFQTLASNLSSEKIAVSADKIEKASNGLNVNELMKAGEIINNVSNNILIHNDKLQNQVHDLNEELKSLKTEHKKYYSMLDSFIVNSSNNKSDDINVNLSEKDFINQIYKELPFMQQFVIYTLFKFQENDLKFPDRPTPKEEFFKKFSEFKKINDNQFFDGVNFATFLAVMSWLSILGYDRKNNVFPEQIFTGLLKHGRDPFKDGDEAYLEFLDDFMKENKKMNE